MAPSDLSRDADVGLADVNAQLRHFAPFAQMQAEHLEQFIRNASTSQHAAGARILTPASGQPSHLLVVLSGHVTGQGEANDSSDGSDGKGTFELETGDLFPIAAIMAERPVHATYSAHDPVTCLQLPVQQVHALAGISKPFAEFMQGRLRTQLALSRQATQASYASQSLAEQSLETPLGQLSLSAPVSVLPATPVAQALQSMHDRAIAPCWCWTRRVQRWAY